MTRPDNDNDPSDSIGYFFVAIITAAALLILTFVGCQVEPAGALPKPANPVELVRCR